MSFSKEFGPPFCEVSGGPRNRGSGGVEKGVKKGVKKGSKKGPKTGFFSGFFEVFEGPSYRGSRRLKRRGLARGPTTKSEKNTKNRGVR